MRSNRDHDYLARLRDHYAAEGIFPSLGVMSEILGFRAKNSAAKLAIRLEEAGFVMRASGGRLVPKERFFELPLFSSPVRAGKPDDAELIGHESVTLGNYLIKKPSCTFLMRISGDAMSGEGLWDGDLVVVERAPNAESGELAVIQIGAEIAIRTVIRSRARGLLPVVRGKSFEPSANSTILGVVRGIARRFPNKKHNAKGGSR